MSTVDLITLRAAAIAVLPQLLTDWLPGGEVRDCEYVALNPMRNDYHIGSFRINLQSGSWRYHAARAGGSDPIALLAYLRFNGDYRKAISALADHPLVRAAIACGTPPPPKTAKTANQSSAANAEAARRLYASAGPLAGSVAAAYLTRRGLAATDAWRPLRASQLRYPRLPGRHPTLIAPITSQDGALVGVHRTFLKAPGTKLDVTSPKLTLGPGSRCCDPLWRT